MKTEEAAETQTKFRYKIIAANRFTSFARNGIELDNQVRDAISRGWTVTIEVEEV